MKILRAKYKWEIIIIIEQIYLETFTSSFFYND